MALKSIFALLVFLLLLNNVYADKKGPFIYAEAGFGIGEQHLGKLSVNIIYGKHVFSTGVYRYAQPAKNSPPDYHAGAFDLFANPTKVYAPVVLWGLMYGRQYTAYHPYCRMLIKGGLFTGLYMHPENFRHAGGLFSSNYDYDEIHETAFGFVVNPVIEFPARYAGISCGVYAVVSNRISGGGINMNFLLGKLREKLYDRIPIKQI